MKYLDPFYWYMRLVHIQFLSRTDKTEKSFVESNITKHRLTQWINVVCIPFTFYSLKTVPEEQMSTLIFALLGTVAVMGTAWFQVSFGSIPAKLIMCSMSVTFFMYTAFKVSLTAMFLAIGFITSPTLWPVISLIYLCVELSCVQYDTADGLKAGLDEALLKHSRAALIYYSKQGIKPEDIPSERNQ